MEIRFFGGMAGMKNTGRLFRRSFVFVLFLVLCPVVTAFAVQTPIINWTDWTSATTGTSGSATGTITMPSGTVTVRYTGEVTFAQLGSGTNYWTQPSSSSLPYTGPNGVPNAPPASELIALQYSGYTNTLAFSSPVVDPVMAFVSMAEPTSGVLRVRYSQFHLAERGAGLFWGWHLVQERLNVNGH